MSRQRRRTFLKMATYGAASITAGGFVGTATAEETVTVSGTVETADGDPAAAVSMQATTGSYPSTTTDSDGRFSLDVSANSRFGFVMYEYRTRLPKRDGLPFIYRFGERSVEDRDSDLGTLTLPEAHVVNLRILHADGEPAPSAEPYIRAKSGHSSSGATGGKIGITREGYLKADGNDEPGVELGGPVVLSAEFHETGAKYQKSFNITEPTSLVVQAGKGFRESSSTPTKRSTTTTDSTATPVTEEATTAASTDTPPTSGRSKTSHVPDDQIAESPEQESETTTNTTQRPKRGFFSNDESASENPEFLEDPFFLTVSGFVLSVGGIVHQMVRGN